MAGGQGFGPDTVKMAGSGKDTPSRAPSAVLREQARSWLAHLAAGDMERSEVARFQEWLSESSDHKTAFAYEQAMWRQADALKESLGPSTWAVAEANSELSPGAEAKALGRGRHVLLPPRRRAFAVLAVAASLLLALFANNLWLLFAADHRTAAGDRLQVKLPDGSVALLNTDSAIDVTYSKRERGIELLRGEAYFTVAKNADIPFVVRSRDSMTRALGTAFAVRDNTDHVTVTVAEGKVEVSDAFAASKQKAAEAAVQVGANQQTTYRDAGRAAPVRSIDAATALAWREGKIIIDSMPFGQAIEELDRYRPGRIVIASLYDIEAPVSGVFSSNSLDAAIGTLAAIQGLTPRHLTPYLVILH